MDVDVVLLPRFYDPAGAQDRTVIVLDVLRATTTMAAALAAGVREVRIFDTLEAASRAAAAFGGPKVLCGERRCLKPEGFDLGNSPGEYTDRVGGRTMFMATTNGTRALVAAGRPASLLIGALVNAGAAARQALAADRPVVLMCAGTDGHVAAEDMIGAGAIIDAMVAQGHVTLRSDAARIAQRLFLATRHDLGAALADAQGGRNVTAAGLAADIDFAARLDGVPVVGQVLSEPLRIVRVG